MTKTLVVQYAPRKDSHTRTLFEEFVQLAKEKTKIISIDLSETPPDLIGAENLNLIMQWNKGKRDFSKKELSILANHHDLIDQVLEVDHIVLAFPIYNFNMPAAVKAWIDAIVVSNKTFSFSPETGFYGLCTDKKALSIIVAGFDYSTTNTVKEYGSSTVKQNFDFMGITTKQVSAFGVDQNRDQLDAILGQAKLDIKNVVQQWFPN